MADRVGVMYAGEIVEEAAAEDFFRGPKHPYSQQLFSAVPSLEKSAEMLQALPGHVEPVLELKSGCRFALVAVVFYRSALR